MDLEFVTTRMAENAEAIRALAEGVSDEQARWKPSAEDWSILEVINHLYDEEREDFAAHLDLILHHPDDPWPRIDPMGWVMERGYNERDLAQSVKGFLQAREASLAWLRGLAAPDWQASYEAPFGEITAGDMMVSWLAHDLLHMRQLVELQWAYATLLVQPYGVRYAGEW
jgi:hypothetical protein